jgi:hypothetical protein
MAKKEETQLIRYSLKEIVEGAFVLNEKYNNLKLSEKELGIEAGIKFSPDINDGTIEIGAFVKYMDDKEELTSLDISVVFKVEQLSKIVKDVEGSIQTSNPQFIMSLVNVALGILRGVLFTRLKDTYLSKFPLPIIPLKDLINEIAKRKEDNVVA